jgi:general secretion pathway protein N
VADSLRPLTLLLGALCLWAIAVLGLSLAGLGSRFAAPAQGIAAPALPKVNLVRTESRLGPLANYTEVGQRPLLSADRRPGLAPAAGGDDAAELDVVLTSVLITRNLQMAIFTDNKDASSRRVKLGEMVSGSNWRLVQLEPRRAVLEGPSGQRDLGLRVFDGKGGQSPTTVVTAPIAPIATTDGGDGAPGSKSGNAAAQVQPAPPPPPADAKTADAKFGDGNAAPMTQEQQVEAIRRRIEARRAQMRAEAAAAATKEK